MNWLSALNLSSEVLPCIIASENDLSESSFFRNSLLSDEDIWANEKLPVNKKKIIKSLNLFIKKFEQRKQNLPEFIVNRQTLTKL